VFYRRRIFEYRTQTLYFASETFPKSLLDKWNAKQFASIQDAYDAAAQAKENPTVVVIPDGKHTLPLVEYDFE